MRTANSTNQARRHRHRRGTIIILVVGILAVLSVAALSYMKVVSLDRTSAAAHATNANFRQQVRATASHIGALLTADLFGNKIVTSTAPKDELVANSNVVIWPKMFEDGEFSDYPSVDTAWLETPTNPEDRGWSINPTWELAFNARTPVDDAWLASQQPVDADGDGYWDTWPQITNLRSAWVWQVDTSAPGSANGYWRRDHGRYVDIGEFLANSQGDTLSGTLGRGDPGIDISNFDTSFYPTAYGEDNIIISGSAPPPGSGPNLGVDAEYLDPTGAAPIGTDLDVFEHQMSRVYELLWDSAIMPDEVGGPMTEQLYTSVQNIDERMWADTDGDGRADARWQELDTLGELFGYKWLVAARIVDNSARINVNSSLEWQMPNDTDNVGAGRTPADIDLNRLLRRTVDTTLGHPDVVANTVLDLPKHYNYNRISGLQVPRALADIQWRYTTPSPPAGWSSLPNVANLMSGSLGEMTSLTRRERELLWEAVGSSPQRRTALSAQPAPLGDEIDLRAYEGSNFLQYVSRTEQRFDQEYTNSPGEQGFLPGMLHAQGDDSYPMTNSLGPLRSREPHQGVLTFGLNAQTPEMDFFSNDYIKNEKLDRLQRDIRRHLTTVSGISDFSPIPPVSNLSQYRRLYVNRKIHLDDPGEIRAPVADVADLIGQMPKITEYVNEAFGAFMWALAPMATDTVTVTGLIPADMGGTATVDPALHYGGAAGGPAETLGATSSEYAILRSASLAVNLADALDRDAANRESPTIALFNPPPTGGTVAPAPTVGARTTLLSTNFSHGSLPSGNINAALNPNLVGANGNGVTLVGLDRQPFLMEVATFAVLEDSRDLAVGNDLPDVDRARLDDQVISMMAIELGNPWPEMIDVSDYVVRISNGTAAMEFRLPLKAPLVGEATIPPGGSKTFVIVFDQDMSSLPGHFNNVRVRFRNELLVTEFTGRGLALGNNNLVELDPSGAGMMIPAGNGAVPFHVYAGDPNDRSVQLFYEDPNDGEFYLVDRMSAVVGTTPGYDNFPWPSLSASFSPFPIRLPGNVQVTGSGRAVFSSSLRRPKGSIAGGGFPSYIIEQPDENLVTSNVAVWQWELMPSPVDPINNPLTLPELMAPVAMAQVDLNLNSGILPNMPSMQLFVPNGPFRSVAELHMLSAFTHQFVNSTPTFNATVSLANAHLGPNPSMLTNNVGLGYWRTISEQLGADVEFYYDGSTEPNPYLGVLDPTRYVLGGDLADPVPTPTPTHYLPDSLRIPLASRVFDCFIVTKGLSRLAQGKINLNTAPLEVIESMPFMAPEDLVNGSMPGTTALPAWIASSAKNRAMLVRDYRDLAGYFDGTLTRSGSLLTGLRDYTDPVTGVVGKRGLVNVGELLSMSNWIAGDGDPQTLTTYEDFMQLGVDDSANDGAPLSLRYATPDTAGNMGPPQSNAVSSDFNEFTPYDTRNDYAVAAFDPVDDPEERLALARSALDIASTRSDVFTAWFILRAYDPEQIEAISVPDTLPYDERAELLDPQEGINPSPGLKPVYETRWLGVFDRSEVKRPNERPRVLMLVRIPNN